MLEGHLMPDHVHMCLSVPLLYFDAILFVKNILYVFRTEY